MKNYPEHIRKVQETFNIPDEDVIEVKVGQEEVRVCDYCNTVLIDEKGMAIQTAYLTDYGLICGNCIGSAKQHIGYLKGDSVFHERWYQEGIDRD